MTAPHESAKARTRSDTFSVADRLQSFRYAATGIAFMLRYQHNAWIHLAITVAVCLTAWWLKVSAADWRWLVVAIVLVWVAEAMNTAFEYACDVISPGLGREGQGHRRGCGADLLRRRGRARAADVLAVSLEVNGAHAASRRPHSSCVAILAPSASDLSFAHMMVGWTRCANGLCAKPQSVPAMTFSRPTMLASRTIRCATSSGCSTMLVAWLMTPGISTLPAGSLTERQTTHSCSWRGLAASN